MTAQSDPYVRVYYRIIDDPKFADVFDDDSRLACWLRLLLLADGTWPAPAPIPATVRRGPLQHLVRVGLIDLVPGGRFRIHGMDPERGERRAKAQKAAATRYGTSSANGEQPQSTSSANAKQLADDTFMHSAPLLSTPLHSAPNARESGDEKWTAALLVEELTRRTFGFGPGSKVFETLSDDVTALGLPAVETAYRSLATERAGTPLDAAGLVFGAHKRLFLIPDVPERETAAARNAREKAEILAEAKAKVRAKVNGGTGGH
jgi:hypothetical protein